MIIDVNKDTLSKKNGNRVATTKVLVKCDDCGVEKWGNWSNYKNNPDGPHYCLTDRNKRGLNGMKDKTHSEEWKENAAKRMKENNPMEDSDCRQKVREAKLQWHKDNIHPFYGKERPDHAESQREFMKSVYAVKGDDADFRKELREKYVTSNRRVSKLQRRVEASLRLAGYDKFKMEQSIADENNDTVYVVDLLWEEKKIVICVNGSFFHAAEDLYRSDDMIFNTSAKEIRERDKKKYKFLESLGYRVIVIWEHKFPKGKKLDYPWDAILGDVN